MSKTPKRAPRGYVTCMGCGAKSGATFPPIQCHKCSPNPAATYIEHSPQGETGEMSKTPAKDSENPIVKAWIGGFAGGGHIWEWTASDLGDRGVGDVMRFERSDGSVEIVTI